MSDSKIAKDLIRPDDGTRKEAAKATSGDENREFSTFKMCRTFIKPLSPATLPPKRINGCSFIFGLGYGTVNYYFALSDKWIELR